MFRFLCFVQNIKIKFSLLKSGALAQLAICIYFFLYLQLSGDDDHAY